MLFGSTGLTPGSPPHTRGIQSVGLAFDHVSGFTPAYAGNTLTCRSRRTARGVHPRIRGEYAAVMSLPPHMLGSPPHTRGILTVGIFYGLNYRFTPAYAGNTGCFVEPVRAL